MAEHPNVGRIRDGYRAFAAGDAEGAMKLFHPDILWHVPGDTPLSGEYKGVGEVAQFFMKLQERSGGTFKIDVHDILANDEHAVALVQVTAQRKGRTLDEHVVHVYHTNEEGMATEYWGFGDTIKFAEFFDD
jgi:ketosteroid isomerase-like protein